MDAKSLVTALLESAQKGAWMGVTFGAVGQPMANVGRNEVVLIVWDGRQVSYFVWCRFHHQWDALGDFENVKYLSACLASLRHVVQVQENDLDTTKDRLLELARNQ